jgi:hypothetical protein
MALQIEKSGSLELLFSAGKVPSEVNEKPGPNLN